MGEQFEIDMGGDVGLAGVLEHVDLLVRLQGLQGGARGQLLVAIVDDQRRAALFLQAPGNLGHHRDRRRAGLDRRALRAGAPAGRDDVIHPLLARLEGELVALQPDHAFEPAVGGTHQLVDRQRVEELVGDNQQRGIVGQGRKIVVVVAIGKGLALDRAQRRRGLDEMHLRREFVARSGCQRISRKRPATRPQLDIVDALAAAHAHPQIGEPQADQLAEHLADFGRGDEIALIAERIAAGIVARVAFGDVVGKADRAGLLDQSAEALAEIDLGAGGGLGLDPGLLLGLGAFGSLGGGFGFGAGLLLGGKTRLFLGFGLGLGSRFGFEPRLLGSSSLGRGGGFGPGFLLRFGLSLGFSRQTGLFFGLGLLAGFGLGLGAGLGFGFGAGLLFGFAARLFLGSGFRFGFGAGLGLGLCLGFRFLARLFLGLGAGFGLAAGLFLGQRLFLGFLASTRLGFRLGLGLGGETRAFGGFGLAPGAGFGSGFLAGVALGSGAGFGFGLGAFALLTHGPRAFLGLGLGLGEGFGLGGGFGFGTGLGLGAGALAGFGVRSCLFLGFGPGASGGLGARLRFGLRARLGLGSGLFARSLRFGGSLCGSGGLCPAARLVFLVVLGIDQPQRRAPDGCAVQAGCVACAPSGFFRKA